MCRRCAHEGYLYLMEKSEFKSFALVLTIMSVCIDTVMMFDVCTVVVHSSCLNCGTQSYVF